MLWAGAIYDFYQSGIIISGQHYGSESQSELIYQVYGDLKTADQIIALAFVISGFFAIYTAIQLIERKQKAPNKLIIYYFISAALPMIHIITTSSCMDFSTAELMYDSIYSSTAGCILGMIVCKVYYDKRNHMFIN